jgi:hypothetical protein
MFPEKANWLVSISEKRLPMGMKAIQRFSSDLPNIKQVSKF